MRHGGAPLQVERNERMGLAASRPGVFRGSEKPDGGGGEAGRLGGSRDDDGSIFRFRREDRVTHRMRELGEKFRPTAAAAVESEGGAGIEDVVPAPDGLELAAGRCG